MAKRSVKNRGTINPRIFIHQSLFFINRNIFYHFKTIIQIQKELAKAFTKRYLNDIVKFL